MVLLIALVCFCWATFFVAMVTTPAKSVTLGEARLIVAVNAERTKRDLVPLRFRETLLNAARYHSADMARRNLLTHISANGWTPAQRVRYFGYYFSRLGECIGRGCDIWRTPEGMVCLWMGSPTHRAILLDPVFRDFGGGMRWNANYTWRYFTADLGRL
jgi:uncharacterized protein YkwD